MPGRGELLKNIDNPGFLHGLVVSPVRRMVGVYSVLQDGAAGATRPEAGGSTEKRDHHLIEDVTQLQCQRHDQRPKDRTRTRMRTYKNTQVEDINWQNVLPYLTEDVKRQLRQVHEVRNIQVNGDSTQASGVPTSYKISDAKKT
ncbi:hypothetical protein DFH08DRAFT_813292 [Mycena albidolilacea]|uniref:Uncharacterized protein n=1 Tax=Mycena albidolilacea TaxID=1033008 RepID=A0AAD6ZSJ4_9AGAR|nr:hypothetical protein DFH08DRAFT_813292 [Mycena albidolilacea]